jgi:hypothetical protein
MQPYVGQIVVIKTVNITSNGTNSHPAFVTRSWNQNDIVAGELNKVGMVNVSVLPDAGHHVIPHTSLSLYATERDGDKVTAARTPAGSEPRPHFAYVAGCGNAEITDKQYAAMLPATPVTRPDGGVDVV